MRAHSMNDDNQILHFDQTRRAKNNFTGRPAAIADAQAVRGS